MWSESKSDTEVREWREIQGLGELLEDSTSGFTTASEFVMDNYGGKLLVMWKSSFDKQENKICFDWIFKCSFKRESVWCSKNLSLWRTSDGIDFKSNNNPYRRYFRCGYAVARKLANDNHTFKWVDEAHLDEIEALKSKTARLEEKLEAVTSERMNEFEKKLFERVEEALAESSSMTKKMVIVVVISCVVMVGFSKLY
ncbi:unnamed protein product [Microthlaspi erraticum]|uniref:Uncharacterized protein n=1 Tax=Microthlaspi erraticum TaxID=1685480 RepID=A0A6D2J095_9BRAS|nr:unnamed protein product [Microthlaspi erraticum]